jgi:hypothetical protein
MRLSVGCTTNTSESEFSVHTGSKRRSTSIKCNDALILPHRANQAGSNFREPQEPMRSDGATTQAPAGRVS